MAGWIGVDLDGTLAHYGGWVEPERIGQPIAPMVARIKEWLGQGIEVRIFTARALDQETLEAIREAKSDDPGGVPVCRDFDEDCAGLNYLKCYLYDPAKGRCPFLSGQNESK